MKEFNEECCQDGERACEECYRKEGAIMEKEYKAGKLNPKLFCIGCEQEFDPKEMDAEGESCRDCHWQNGCDDEPQGCEICFEKAISRADFLSDD